MKRILIATDGSVESQAAVEEGTELAHQVDGSILFVYVKPWPPTLLGEPYYQRRLSQDNGDAEEAVRRATDAALAHGVESDWEIVEGDPAAEIMRMAKARDADVIVVGSRGLGAVRGALLGSVSRRVVHEADRPVLVARPRAATRRMHLVA